MNEEESCRPRDPFSVFGSDSPILGQSDNAEYAVLRPRVMLSSGQDSELYVPSGVLVQDRTGDKCRWDYMGKGSHRHIADGIRGSPAVCEGGIVVGFFWYAPKAGHFVDWALSVVPDELIDQGLDLI